MIGVIDNINSISGTLNSNLSITGSLSSTNQLVGGLNLNGSVYADYSGDYEITPRVESQTLPTKNKVLRDNMEVKEIPYYETSNEYGNTIYIGSEVEVNGN